MLSIYQLCFVFSNIFLSVIAQDFNPFNGEGPMMIPPPPDLIQKTEGGCTRGMDRQLHIYTGWPLILSCRLHELGIFVEIPEGSLQCDVVDVEKNVTVMEKSEKVENAGHIITYMEPQIFRNSSQNYKVYTRFKSANISALESRCSVQTVQIRILEFEQLTCQQSAFQDPPTKPLDGAHENRMIFSCDGVEDEFFTNVEEYDVNWYRNCSTSPSNSHRENEKLVLPRIEYENAGVYTCAVTYKGMTLFSTHHWMCVTQRQKIIAPEVLCPIEGVFVETSLGEDVVMSLQVAIGNGGFHHLEFEANWNKTDEKGAAGLCKNYVIGDENGIVINRTQVSCSMTQRTEKECHLHIANETERIVRDNVLMTSLRISNVEEKDFGNYSFTLKSESYPQHSTTCRVHLVQADNPQTLILLVIVLFLFISLAIFLVLYLRVFFKVLFKRRFGKIEKDSCKVFLSYDLSHTNFDERTKLKALFDLCHSHLVKLGCEIFVENRDGNTAGESQIKTVGNVVLDSDRVLFIITSRGYLEDTWAISKFQKIYEKSVETKVKMIFVIAPAIRQRIREEQNSTNCMLISKAMKESHVIDWPSRKSCVESDTCWLRLELENAFPKVRKTNENHELNRITNESTQPSCGEV